MGKGLRVKVVVIVIVIVDVTNNSFTCLLVYRQLNNLLVNLSFVFFLLYEFLYDLHGVVLHL
jgi:hypothetical protein